MKRLLSTLALFLAALNAQAGVNLLSAELQNVAIRFTDLDPTDAFVPVETAVWRDIVTTGRFVDDTPGVGDHQQADAGAWGDRQMASTGTYADGTAGASLAFVNGAGTMTAQLSHAPQPGALLRLNAGAVRRVPLPLSWSDPQGLLVIAPHTAVSLSADYLLSYRLEGFQCFADASCPYAVLNASLFMTERLREPWLPRFEDLEAREIRLDARDLDPGTALARDETGHLSLTFTNDTDEYRYALAELGLGMGLGVQPALPVPEPETAALFAAGLGALALMRRRRTATMRRCPLAPARPTTPFPATSAPA
jgi:hypothetical protein